MGHWPLLPHEPQRDLVSGWQVQLYRSLDKCHRGPLIWSTSEEKMTHLPGFLDVLTPIGEYLLNSELLAGSQEDNIRPLY